MRILTENFPLKLFSLVLAVAFWMFLIGETEVAASVPVFVQYRNLPRDLEISSEQIDRVYLKVSGPSSRLTAEALNNAAVLLDLGSVQNAGEQTFTLDRSNVDLPSGLAVLRVVPSRIRLRFERRATKQVPVEVRFGGPPPQGYRISRMDVQPHRLEVVGPESRVEHVDVAATDALDLAGKVGNAEYRVPVYVTDPQVQVQLPAVVNVRIVLEKIPAATDR
jgi:YbbR domain-containing protein